MNKEPNSQIGAPNDPVTHPDVPEHPHPTEPEGAPDPPDHYSVTDPMPEPDPGTEPFREPEPIPSFPEPISGGP